jgi:hypothetical protein
MWGTVDVAATQPPNPSQARHPYSFDSTPITNDPATHEQTNILKEEEINPLCECGKEAQDSVHLYKCVDEIYGNTKSMDAKGNHDINSILNYFNLPPIAGMMAERKDEYRRVYDAKEAERGHARERGHALTLA